MQTTLTNKTAVITGGAQGLGFAMAEKFLDLGAKVWILDLDLGSLQTAQGALSSDNLNILVCDVTKRADVEKAFAKITHADVLVNNAGILRDASLFKMTDTQFDAVIDVHLNGTFLMTQIFAASMKAQNSGAIINLSSVASMGNFGQTNYAAAKAGIIGITKTWALELSRYNIRVNAIAPGLIETEMTASIPENIRDQMIKQIPLKRMGKPVEIANLACFLASDAASYVQGQVIHINGGYYV